MEIEIGKPFEYEGKKLEAVETDEYDCSDCFFIKKSLSFCSKVKCAIPERFDYKNVYFKEVK